MSILNNQPKPKPIQQNLSDLIQSEKKARFNCYIPESLLKELKHTAIEDSKSMTDIATELFGDYVKRRKGVKV